jgi:hypothetical protein
MSDDVAIAETPPRDRLRTWGREPVGTSPDLTRVLNLPRRPRPALPPLAYGMTERLRRHNPKCGCDKRRGCITDLNGIQGWGLFEVAAVGGALFPIGVGHGKTGLDVLAAMVLPGCKVAVLLIPPNLRAQFVEVDFPAWAQHFNVPNLAGGKWFVPGRPVLHVVSYSELSNAKSTDLLRQLNPDLIIADEAHNLRNATAARTKRFLRYMNENKTARFCAWSGTLTSRSLKDYAHLAALALRSGSPLPLHPPVVEEWASALDPSDWPAAPGALESLCAMGEEVRSGFRRRLTDTHGVVATEAGSVGCSLVISERKAPPIPPEVVKAIHGVHETWKRPDGEEYFDILQVARCARELSCGFFYRWKYPRGEPREVIEAWFAARKAWHAELREKLKRGREHMDSPALCEAAAARWHYGYTFEGIEYPPEATKGPLPAWASTEFLEWQVLRNQVEPESEAVWIDDFLARDCAEWLKGNLGIVWYAHDAFGRRVAELTGAPLYGPNSDPVRNLNPTPLMLAARAKRIADGEWKEDSASNWIGVEQGERSIIATYRAHGTGTNLQYAFSKMLFGNASTSGDQMEQTIGRVHRFGQPADEVTVEIYRHTADVREGFEKARREALYIEETQGLRQKLNQATYVLAAR